MSPRGRNLGTIFTAGSEPHLAGSTSQRRLHATFGGLGALAIWSTTVGIVRGVTESLGMATGAALAMGLGGLAALLVSWVRGRGPGSMLRLPRKYLLGCGGMFVAYELCFLTAVGLSPNRMTVLAVGLVNYLWAVMTVVLSVPILHRRARWPLAAGCVVAVAGMAVAVVGTFPLDWAQLRRSGPGIALPLALALVGAVLWGAYSNFTRRWGSREGRDGAVPLFLLATGAALALLTLVRDERTVWTTKAAAELAVLAIAQSAIAYVLWDAGMRKGNHLLLSLASYFLPLAATAVAAVYLQVTPGAGLIAGCALVTAGALICRWSISADAPDDGATDPR